jgi:hypothetical protein
MVPTPYGGLAAAPTANASSAAVPGAVAGADQSAAGEPGHDGDSSGQAASAPSQRESGVPVKSAISEDPILSSEPEAPTTSFGARVDQRFANVFGPSRGVRHGEEEGAEQAA